MRYRSDLDGLRAFAVFAVLGYHFSIGVFAGGWLGVDVFFVLSGYLITTLLLTEHQETGSISLAQFYARRALRLFPALLLTLLLTLPFAGQLGGVGFVGRGAVASALYVENFILGFNLSGVGPFSHTWSLGVEEQFYLAAPMVLLWLVRQRRDPLPWLAAAVAASWAVLAATSLHLGPNGNPPAGYFLPWSRFSQLLVGSCVAVAILRRRSPTIARGAAAGWTVVAATVALVLGAAHTSFAPHLAWQAPTIALLTAALLLHLDVTDGGLRAVLGWKLFAYLGRRSYGIYLYHWPAVQLLQPRLHHGKLVTILAELIVTISVAITSYRFVELPFLRLKHRRFEPNSHRPEPVPT